jgi:hypothetical protein
MELAMSAVPAYLDICTRTVSGAYRQEGQAGA